MAAHVEELIEDGDLRAGDRIASKSELRAQTGLSIATINEGVRLLQARGRVVARPGPGGGLFATEPRPMVKLGESLLAARGDGVTLRDLIAVRDALEPVIAEEAARYRDEDDVADLRGHLAQMSEALGDPNRFVSANWRLHRRIAKICRNELARTVYLTLVRTIESRVDEAVHPDGEAAHRRYKRERLRLHEDYVDAIARGDVAEAQRLAVEHAPDQHQ